MNANFFATVLLTLSAFVSIVYGLPTGAPTTACKDMTPNHLNYRPQTSASPFRTVPANTLMAAGENLDILLETTATNQFRGFLTMAFDASNTGAGPIGIISSVSDGQVIECTAGFLNAATHVDNVDKSQVSLVWTAPADFTGTVVFWTTFVQAQDIFWVQVPSATVTVA
ncbi:putative defense protein 3 [Daphnia pulex]|uniref:putative defense protein 3 n=1 Tax=Daphnia pulex TaxID=6669 RepID=UPI001EDEC36A|nr:putative defense protein 3 [Daphnia pulex]